MYFVRHEGKRSTRLKVPEQGTFYVQREHFRRAHVSQTIGPVSRTVTYASEPNLAGA